MRTEATDPSQRPSQREKQRAATRERIFESALGEFRRVGVESAQIPSIAEAAGVVRGTFYYHFPSKDHVLFELRDRVQEEIARTLDAIEPRGASFELVLTALFEAIQATAAKLGENRLLGDLMGTLVRLQMSGEVDEESAVHAALVRHVESAIERGEVGSGLAPDPLARMILNSIFGLVAAPRPSHRDLGAEFELLRNVFLRGLGTGSECD